MQSTQIVALDSQISAKFPPFLTQTIKNGEKKVSRHFATTNRTAQQVTVTDKTTPSNMAAGL